MKIIRLFIFVVLHSLDGCWAWEQLPTPKGGCPSTNHHHHHHHPRLLSPSLLSTTCDRRQLVTATLMTLTSGYVLLSPLSSVSQAAELLEESPTSTTTNDNRPRAPLEALIPATQQRLLIESALEIARQLKEVATADTDTQTKTNDGYLQQLKEILEPPPSDDDDNSKGRLQKQQAIPNNFTRLSGRSVRASMNVYTAKLRFGGSYILTASPDIRKKMIRDEQLPDVKTVIAADLDLRDLYRNQLQTTMEDAQAELYSPNFTAAELVDLLQQASSTCQTWFGFISPQDVQEARDAVLQLSK